jgi:tetratricopeptide (TPR) repeat protein
MYIDSIKKYDEFINLITDYGSHVISDKNIQFSPYIQQIAAKYDNAMNLMRSGDKLGALREYKHILNIAPEFVAARYNLAYVYKESNNLEEAIRQFEIAAKINPQDLSILIEIGAIYSDMGKKQEELEIYFKALSIDPEFVPAMKNLGLTYLELDQEDEALKWFQQALNLVLKQLLEKYSEKLNIELLKIYNGLGNTYRKMGNYSMSEDYFFQGVELGDLSRSSNQFFLYFETRLWMDLGCLYLEWEEWDQAEKYFRKCLQRDPDNIFYKGFLQRAQGKY